MVSQSSAETAKVGISMAARVGRGVSRPLGSLAAPRTCSSFLLPILSRVLALGHADVLAHQNPGFDRDAADHVLPQDGFDPLRRDSAVDRPFRPDQQDRAFSTDAEAVGLGAKHDPLRPRWSLQAQLPHKLFEAAPAGGAEGWIGAAEGLGGGGTEQ